MQCFDRRQAANKGLGMGRLSEGFTELMHKVDRRVGWHRLPVPLGFLTLRQMRKRLRQRNLHDTGTPPDLEASTNRAPARSTASAISLDTSGPAVLISTKTWRSLAALEAPPSPR